jgi:hypothetical protein
MDRRGSNEISADDHAAAHAEIVAELMERVEQA